MKICIVGSVYARSQDDTEVPWLRETVRRLREKGVDVHILVPSRLGLKSHTIDGTPVHRFRYFFKPWETLTGEEGAPNRIHKFHYKIITLFYILFGTLALIRLNLKHRFDILHVHWPFPHAIFAFGAIRFRRTKVLLHFYGAELLLMRKFGFVKSFLRTFIKNADGVMAISNFTASQVRAIYDREVTMIPYGAAITQKSATHADASDKQTILCVGRMVERKGFEYAVRAMPAVLEKFPQARLCFVGGGNFKPLLEKLTAELRLEKSVRFTGIVSNEELAAQFSKCTMFVMPSIIDSRGDTEGLGVVLLEALSYGKPVIGTNVGGIPDIITNEKTGLLVPEKNPAALAEAIITFLADPNLREKLAAQGLKHIKAEFDWDVIIEKLIAVFNDTVQH